eukprot:749858-Hanusia_phi.AAC.11
MVLSGASWQWADDRRIRQEHFFYLHLHLHLPPSRSHGPPGVRPHPRVAPADPIDELKLRHEGPQLNRVLSHPVPAPRRGGSHPEVIRYLVLLTDFLPSRTRQLLLNNHLLASPLLGAIGSVDKEEELLS